MYVSYILPSSTGKGREVGIESLSWGHKLGYKLKIVINKIAILFWRKKF